MTDHTIPVQENTAVDNAVPRKFWRGFWLGLAFFGVFFAASQIIGSVAGAVYLIYHFVRNGVDLPVPGADVLEYAAQIVNSIPGLGAAIMIGLILGSVCAILAIPLLYKLIKVNGVKRPAIRSLELGKIKPATIALSVVAGLGLIAFVDAALSLLPIPGAMIEQFNNVFSFAESTPRWLTLLAIGIIAPIAEELGIRSGVFCVMRRDSSFWAAALMSSLLFGLMHGIPLQICYATVIGFLLAFVCEVTKSVVPCIIIHIVNNSWSYVMPTTAADNVSSFLFGGPQVWMTLAVGAVLLGGSLFGMVRLQRDSTWQVIYEVSGEKALAAPPQ